jgi:hypothetical protein
MQVSTEQLPWVTENRLLGPADVLEVDLAEDIVRLRLSGSEDDIGVWARIAIAADCELEVGDKALVIGEGPCDLYVIGLLGRKKPAPGTTKKLFLDGGAYATAAGPREEQILRVFSGQNELLFEYDEAKRTARVNVDCGDLEFVARNGNIAFSSGRDVLIQGQSVAITSPSAIQLETTDAGGEVQAAVLLRNRRIELCGPEISVSAERGDVHIAEAAFTGRRFLAEYREGKVVVERLETFAKTLIEKAKNVYRTVEELSQLKAGRLRTLVDSTFFFRSKRAFIKSEEDYKIKAEKIHLG